MSTNINERVKADNYLTGKCVNQEITDEADHFYVCRKCGQAVDMRDLGQVFHHEQETHKPLTVDA